MNTSANDDFSLNDIVTLDENKVPLFFAINYFEAVFDDAEIDAIKKIANKYPEEDGQLLDMQGNAYNHKAIRSSVVKRLNNSDAELAWVIDRLKLKVAQTNAALRWNFILSGFYENIQYAKYDSSQGGHYAKHSDLAPGLASYRKISISVQLSDETDYEGGGLEVHGFPAAPKKKGGVIIFPSFAMHRVTPVTQGVRESLVAWVAGPPFR